MKDFITSFFNINPSDIEDFSSSKVGDTLFYFITLTIKQLECPLCGAKATSHGKHKKPIKHSITSNFESVIIWIARRYKCTVCNHTFLEDNPFSFAGLSVSIAVQQSIMKGLKNPNLTYKDIAETNHVSVSTVQRLFDSWVNVPRQKLPECLGIDEIHSDMAKRYGSAYLCTFVDNDKRSLVEILPSRAKHDLNKYLDSIPKIEKDSVLYVTIDMWEPYLHVSQRHFKNAVVAVDPFHVVKNLGECFTRLRINVMNQCEKGSTNYYLLKSWHRLLECDYNLDNEPQYNHFFNRKLNYRNLYEMTLSVDDTLASAYQLKELYRSFNSSAAYENAEHWLDLIIEKFNEADITEYRPFIQLINTWKPYIINSFLRPYNNRKLSNALAENINGKIRAYLAVSRGVANFPRFRRRMIYALNDRVFYSATSHLKSDKREGKTRGNYKK